MRAREGRTRAELGTDLPMGGWEKPSQDWSLESRDLGFEHEQEKSKLSMKERSSLALRTSICIRVI